MKLLVLILVLLLSGCATGRVCFDEKQLMFEIPLGKEEPKEPDKWWHCYRREWRKGNEIEPIR